jgi:Bacterial protein of unknown function (DUF922)
MHLTTKRNYISVPIILLVIIGCGFTLLQHKEKVIPTITVTVVYDTTKFSTTDTITYTNKTALQWTDFTATAPVKMNNENTVANSGVGFKFSASIQKSGNYINIGIRVSSFFIKPKSWVLSDSKTAHILNHEQRHFDIARYGAELLRQNFLKAKFNAKNINLVMTNIYNATWNTYLSIQGQYDRETNHSINKTQQQIWDKKIADWLLQVK